MVELDSTASSVRVTPSAISVEQWTQAVHALSTAEGRVGISFIQRQFRMCYSAASAFVERLHQAGAVSDIEQNGFRTSLVREVPHENSARYWVTTPTNIAPFNDAVARLDHASIGRLGKLLEAPADLE